MTIAIDVQSLQPGALVEMFELNLNSGLPDDVFYFHAGNNELSENLVWQGVEYQAWPIEASGFAKTGQGTLPRPKLVVANINGFIGALARQNDDLINARLVRRRTFVKYLDAVNFASGNPDADPNQHFPDEVWFIARRSQSNNIFVEFELACPWDVQGVKLPRGQVVQNVCRWISMGGYRGPYCGYSGPPVADAMDVPTSDPSKDVCGGRLSSCRLRFPDADPYGGFPAAGLINV